MPRRWIVGHIAGFGDFCAQSLPGANAGETRLRNVTLMQLQAVQGKNGQQSAVPAYQPWWPMMGGLCEKEVVVPTASLLLVSQADPKLVKEIRSLWGEKDIVTPPKPKLIVPGGRNP